MQALAKRCILELETAVISYGTSFETYVGLLQFVPSISNREG